MQSWSEPAVDDNSLDTDKSASSSAKKKPKIIVGVLLLAIVSFVVADQVGQPCAGCRPANNGTAANNGTTMSLHCACISAAFDSLTSGIAGSPVVGSIICTLVLAVCAVVLIPASALTIGAGAAFARALGVGVGVLVGSIVVWIGLAIGAMCAFLLARYLLREAVERQLRKFRLTSAIDAALKQEGLKVMVLLRLSPLIPFNAFNYVIAATAVSFRDYALALPAMIPASIGYVYIGATVAEAVSGTSQEQHESAEAVRMVLLVIGAVATVVAVAAISCVATRRLRHLDHASGGLAGRTTSA